MLRDMPLPACYASPLSAARYIIMLRQLRRRVRNALLMLFTMIAS